MIFLSSGFLLLTVSRLTHSATTTLKSKLPPAPLQEPETWAWATIDNGRVFIANRNFGSNQDKDTELKLKREGGDSRIKKKRVLETSGFIETAIDVLEEESGNNLHDELKSMINETIEIEIEEFGIDVDVDENISEVIDTGVTELNKVNELESDDELNNQHSNENVRKNLTSTVTEYFPLSTPLLEADDPVINFEENECDRFSCLVVKAYNSVVAQFSK